MNPRSITDFDCFGIQRDVARYYMSMTRARETVQHWFPARMLQKQENNGVLWSRLQDVLPRFRPVNVDLAEMPPADRAQQAAQAASPLFLPCLVTKKEARNTQQEKRTPRAKDMQWSTEGPPPPTWPDVLMALDKRPEKRLKPAAYAELVRKQARAGRDPDGSAARPAARLSFSLASPGIAFTAISPAPKPGNIMLRPAAP